VKPHAEWRQQGRYQDLKHDADAQTERTAEAGSRAIFHNQHETQEFRQKQQHGGCAQQTDRQFRMPLGPKRKETRRGGKIDGRDQRFDGHFNGTEGQKIAQKKDEA